MIKLAKGEEITSVLSPDLEQTVPNGITKTINE